MAQASVKTVQFLDPRIEPQPDPVYDYVIGPTQNQYYQIPASGCSDSSITFNNLTTLGADRAYLDTFELETTVEITFHLAAPVDANMVPMSPTLEEIVFDSFPFNKCCGEARVNINGGSFFSQPMCYIRAKEHYMNQEKLANCYANICPINRPLSQYESARDYTPAESGTYDLNYVESMYASGATNAGHPTRLGAGKYGTSRSAIGFRSSSNNSIIVPGGNVDAAIHGYPNYHLITNDAGNAVTGAVLQVTWREPVFCSPFSSRYDADFGRPLYNITSMDLNFLMHNLGNMIRYVPMHIDKTEINMASYEVHIKNCRLCYQVMTIPSLLNKPLTTLVPYRRFVPYITTQTSTLHGQTSVQEVPQGGTAYNAPLTIRSGVYTLNEIPTAIWVFIAPTKERLQNNDLDIHTSGINPTANEATSFNAWDSNKQFAFIESVDFSLANTTQILSTAQPLDLYRIAKANGCDDTFESWGIRHRFLEKNITENQTIHGKSYGISCLDGCYGCGSVLRLRPGVDLIVPDQPLIPGANAKNMVFQANVSAHTPPNSTAQRQYALWIIFEYVGVAAISPGQCEISMNPLGDGQVMAVSPIVSATSEATEGEVDGSGGFWNKARRGLRVANAGARDLKSLWGVVKNLPGDESEKVGKWLQNKMGSEIAPATKRARGGAVMGKGYKDWI